MKTTLKEYLLQEKVSSTEYNTILNDQNFRVGLEFEYYDRNIANKTKNESKRKLVASESVEVVQTFEELLDYVKNRYKPSVSSIIKYRKEEWSYDQIDNLEKILIQKVKVVKDKLQELNTQHNTSYKFLAPKTYIELNNEFRKFAEKNTNPETRSNKVNEIFKPYGIDAENTQSNHEAKELSISYHEVFKIAKRHEEAKTGTLEYYYDPIRKKNLTYIIDDKDRELLADEFEFQEDKLKAIAVAMLHREGDYKSNPRIIIDDIIDNIINYVAYASDDNKIEEYLDEFINVFNESPEDNYEKVDDFLDSINHHFNFSDFPYDNIKAQYNSSTSHWTIIHDESLEFENGGIEIVSPILTLNEAIRAIKNVSNYIHENGQTHDNTGLHINLSYKGVDMSNVDAIKMFLFMEEGWIQKDFPTRMHSNWTNSVHSIIKKSFRDYTEDDIYKVLGGKSFSGKDFPKILKQVMHFAWPDKNKYSGINISNMKGMDGRIEFRYLGDRNYERDTFKITKHLLRFCYILKLGIDKKFKLKEYHKKIVNLLSSSFKSEIPYDISKSYNYYTNYIQDNETGDFYYKTDDNTYSRYRLDKNKNKTFVSKINARRFEKIIQKYPNQYTKHSIKH